MFFVENNRKNSFSKDINKVDMKNGLWPIKIRKVTVEAVQLML